MSDMQRALVPSNVVDRRAYAMQAHGPQRQWKVYERRWLATTGVCLHQTACKMGERPERYDATGAHAVVTANGQIIWLHDWNKVVAAANGWNNGCVSLEIDGLYAGVAGRPDTLWDDPSTSYKETESTLTPAAIEASKAFLRWVSSDLYIITGRSLHAIVSHRQSSANRRDDPGSAIWKAIALPMLEELKATDGGVGFKLDDGYPIPQEWDPRKTGIKY